MHKTLHIVHALSVLLLAVSPAMAGCSGANDIQTGEPESVQGEAAVRALSPAARVAQLAALLRTKGAITMPPLGRKHFANEMKSHVDLLPPLTQGISGLFRDRMVVSSP